jgi:hypothetical protein
MLQPYREAVVRGLLLQYQQCFIPKGQHRQRFEHYIEQDKSRENILKIVFDEITVETCHDKF